ncbi:hypothetical protein [Streptomyces sp. NBC_01565]|uniref:hypothetical protein n=1 Tax=Streptomyces sp. NBC_01565 TaxID=2975881 RepID=UPI00224E9E0B|nr:hypothetical protein [Streptomyces sp. NBC_01565]MCX4543817.1 hypothetical protein [Streptomyces sp. NBC_01565]
MTEQPARTAAFAALAKAGLNRYEANTLLNNHAHEAVTPVMQIVTDYVIESNDIGGIDCNDLADRLRTAGYPLVGDDDHDAPDDDE